MDELIPKIIHYCWFGDKEKPKKVIKNIEEWKKINPDYKIIEWNEKNFDISSSCSFVRDAYKNKKWSFVTDFVRLYVVYNYGGIYLDTDVKLIKPLNYAISKFRNGYMGFEDKDKVNSGLGFASSKGNSIIAKMINYYMKLSFDPQNLSAQACPVINSLILKNEGFKINNEFQQLNYFYLLPTDYLCPFDIYNGKYNIDANTISIHMYDASWMRIDTKMQMYTIYLVKKLLPNFLVNYIRKRKK